MQPDFAGLQGKNCIGSGMETRDFHGSKPPSDQAGDGSNAEDDPNFVPPALPHLTRRVLTVFEHWIRHGASRAVSV